MLIFSNVDVLTVTKQIWQLYFDGSYTQHGLRVGFLFITPQGHTIPKAYKLNFPYTNNMARYEALVIGIKMEIE